MTARMQLQVACAALLLMIASPTPSLAEAPRELHWMKIPAQNKVQRTKLANTGITIEAITGEDIIAVGTTDELQQVQNISEHLTHFPLHGKLLDYPAEDSRYHNYQELVQAMRNLADSHPEIVKMHSIGESYEGRSIYTLTLSTDLEQSHEKPAIYFLGGHHAREHLSVEIPLMLAQHLVSEFKAGNVEVQKLLTGREIHITPLVNPDGAEHDIATSTYQMWRKNRRPVDGGYYGVDLNRNYSFQFDTGGASDNPSSDTYHGPHAFSEPETQAVKNFVESRPNISILLSFHTFSELILYPWGHSYDPITDSNDRRVHEIMAQTMSQWNDYTPQQSSDLYIASGDTTDWSYGVHNIISFTFELDPKSFWNGGFYPGDDIIDQVFAKNLPACLYLMDYADNPYRVLASPEQNWGLNTPLFSTF